MNSIILITLLVFVISFLFALGGVGSAVALVPLLDGMGLPYVEARATGLYVNALTLFAATFRNWRMGKLNLQYALPVLLSSVSLAPVGAWLSTLVAEWWVGLVFALFLLSAAASVLLFSRAEGEATPRQVKRPWLLALLIGAFSGLLAGFLGVGGGGLIITVFLFLGFDAKFAVVTTAFVVPFSSLTGFLGYAGLGQFNWQYALPLGLAALVSGLVATQLMHQRIKSGNMRLYFGYGVLVLGLLVLATKVLGIQFF